MSTFIKYIGITVLIAFSVFVVSISVPRNQTPPDFFTDTESFYSFWEKDIATHGTEESYHRFTKAYEASEVQTKHTLGHAFAELLYAKEGLQAMAVCDNKYSYSCFHEIVASETTQKGMEALQTINKFCEEKVWCQHGIGHGVIKLSGYDFNALRDAVAACDTIPRYDPIDGCLGGVFMEFYTYRPVSDEEDATQPCTEVPEDARASCHFWLGQWFLSNPPEVEVYARFAWAAEQCSKIDELNYRLNCYKRIGYDTGNYATDAETARSYCEKSIPQGDEYFEVQCKAGAAAMFYSYENTRAYSETLCLGLTGDKLEYCMYAAQKLPYTHDRRIENYLSI